MRINPNAYITIAAIFFLQSGCANAELAHDICEKLSRERKPAAYLVAPTGKIDKGPIDLGKLPLDNNIDDEKYSINSGYRVIITPNNLEAINIPPMSYGAELLKEKNSVCSKANTYSIKLRWSRQKGELRPYKFEVSLPYFERLAASGYAEEVNDLYKFDPRIIGEMVAP